MRFLPTPIPGLLHIEPTPHSDARGLFSRLFCPREFAAVGIGDFAAWQISLSRNPVRHTLRGMHISAAPAGETKLVRAVQGRAYDVAIDLRPDSPTRGRWHAIELDAAAMNAVLVPAGLAHGFLTLQPDTDILYQISPLHAGDETLGVRWDDRALGVDWPARPVLMSDRDAVWPDWTGS